MSKHRIFVMGGNGFVGSHVVRQLIEHGYEVVCLLRESSRTERIDNLPVEASTLYVRVDASFAYFC